MDSSDRAKDIIETLNSMNLIEMTDANQAKWVEEQIDEAVEEATDKLKGVLKECITPIEWIGKANILEGSREASKKLLTKINEVLKKKQNRRQKKMKNNLAVEKNYEVECIFCGNDKKLRMYAHRIKGKMVGWIFVCQYCTDKVDKVKIEIHIEEPPKYQKGDAVVIISCNNSDYWYKNKIGDIVIISEIDKRPALGIKTFLDSLSWIDISDVKKATLTDLQEKVRLMFKIIVEYWFINQKLNLTFIKQWHWFSPNWLIDFITNAKACTPDVEEKPKIEWVESSHLSPADIINNLNWLKQNTQTITFEKEEL